MNYILNIIKSLLYAVFIYMGIKTGTVKVLFYLMVMDSILGIIKALRFGYKFSFKRLGWGMVSKISLLLIPMILALIAKGINLDFTLFVVTAMNILIVSEGISCITNILSIRTKKRIENSDYVTRLLNSVRKFLSSLVQHFPSMTEEENKNNTKK